MKKYFIGLGMILLVANGAMAQSKKGDFEVNASWGYLSMPEIDGIASTAFSYLATLGTYCSDNKSFTGAIAVAGKYYVTNRINVGLALTYEQEKREPWSRIGGTQTKLGDIHVDSYCIMPSASVIYLNKKYIQLYGDVAVGVGIQNERFTAQKGTSVKNDSNTSTYFAFQLSPIGVRVGGKLAGFAEYGVGYKGCILAGISYRF